MEVHNDDKFFNTNIVIELFDNVITIIKNSQILKI